MPVSSFSAPNRDVGSFLIISVDAHLFTNGRQDPSIELGRTNTLFSFNVLPLETSAVLQRGGSWKKCRNTSSFSKRRSVNNHTRLNDKCGAKCGENCVSKMQGSVKVNSGSFNAGSYFFI